MTREEAIAILENEKKCVNRANKNDYCNRDCYNCELVKTNTEILNALDMAIKTLEQNSNLEKICEELAAENDDLRDQLAMRDKFQKQEPCDKCVYSTKDGYCQYDDISETIPPLEPCIDAQERYEDLCEYFGDAKDILKSRKDFKAWLERIKWHIHKAEELYEKYEHKQEPCDLLIIKSHILLHQDDRKKWIDSIKREKESGVIILPPYFEPLLVPSDIEISIEQEPCDDNRLYIKVYADLEPQEKAEKLYQICEKEELLEVYKELGEYCEIEPCNDAVSRQAVLDCATLITSIPTEDWDIGDWVCLFRDRVSQLPPVRPQESKWIPVSERLPEDGTYLVTLEKIVGEPRIDIRSFAQDLNKVDEFDFPKQKWGWYDYDSEYGYWEDTGVIAWMHLPTPYNKPQESEKVNCKSTKCENCINHNYCDFEPQEREDNE